MFPFDAVCSYCRELCPNIEKNGKFYCSKTKTYVSANQSVFACNYRAESMGRSQTEKNNLARISKSHGYYVITAISEILGLDPENEYMCAFKYLRDVVMPASDEYTDFIADYDIDGPVLADSLRNDEEAADYAEYLRSQYLNGFVSLFCENQIAEAVSLYSIMLSEMKGRYDYRRTVAAPQQLALA